MIVLDTSILSLAFRRRPGAPRDPRALRFAELLEEDEPMAVPAVVLQEFLSGIRDELTFRRLDDLLGGFPLLLATRATHVAAAKIRNACRDRGVAASTVDVLIAAHAIESRGALFTSDDDFRHIASVCPLALF